jgi:hypothetical protein
MAMPEEQDVHAGHDGHQREHVKHDACLTSHRFTLLLDDRVAATDLAAVAALRTSRAAETALKPS